MGLLWLRICRVTTGHPCLVMELSGVIPFGLSLDEYRRMFRLSDSDLKGRLLGAGDGPASFNAELTAVGGCVVSVDPLYSYSAAEIRGRFDAVLDDIIEQVKASPGDWVWSYHKSPEDLRANRVAVIRRFADDYEAGRGGGRYVRGEPPSLDFSDSQFDLALCSHLLFLYSGQLDREFHLRSVIELLRVASEVRIFPLLTLRLERSPHLAPVMEALSARGCPLEIVRVDYELQRGGDEMLVVRRPSGS